MLFTVVDLEREAVQFNLIFAPGIVDYGFDIRQLDSLAVDGSADLIVEHRGPGELTDDIRVRATYTVALRPSAPAVLTLSNTRSPASSTCFSPHCGRWRCFRALHHHLGDRNRLLSERWRVAGGCPARAGGPVASGQDLCREDCKGLCPKCDSI